MLDFFSKLFSSDFMPHGHCYFWRPEIVWLHVCSDAVIAFSYYLIPIALIYVVRKRRDIAFDWMIILFGVFILACGTSHLMSIWTLWHGTYRLEGVIKLITALVSLLTAVLLIRLIPQALLLPSPAQLRMTNQALELEIHERSRIESMLAERAAELERSNGDLQQFASVASHDLQEPLRKIQAFGNLLERECDASLPEPGRLYLKKVFVAADRMRTLIHDLLAYSRITSTAQPFEPVNLTETVQQVISDLEVVIRDSGATIEVDALPTVDADATQIRQLFQNLISNALKFRDVARAPIVHIGTCRDTDPIDPVPDDPTPTVTIQVVDNGIGFDEKYRDRIFLMFQRLHGRSEYDGTGIGLAICRRIVDRHGGTITARSRPGVGSTFLVTLPLSPSSRSRENST